MSKYKKTIGNAGEELAEKYLIENGYKIITRNYRVGRMGEVDILASDKDYLVAVEVKTRSDENYGSPFSAINYKKMKTLHNLAKVLLVRFQQFKNFRFDVIGIILKNNQIEKIELIKNAFLVK